MVGFVEDACDVTSGRVGVEWRRAVQVGASGSAGLVLAQVAFAGPVVGGRAGLVRFHATGSHVLFCLALLIAVASVLGWRRGQLPAWVGLVGGPSLFLATTVQLLAGYTEAFALHVPLGVGLLGLSLVLALVTTRPLDR